MASNVVAFKQKDGEKALQLIVAETAYRVSPLRDPEKLKLHNEIVVAYYNHRKAQNFQDDSISRDDGFIADFERFTGKFTWECDCEDFEAWSTDLGVERKLATSSQRMYQGVIRRFLDYIIENQKFSNIILLSFGIRVRQICTPENCIAHVLDRELAKERPAMTKAQADKFFAQLRQDINEAEQFNGKDRFALKRDYAMFYLYYVSGFRADEGLQLNLHSFAENPKLPVMGPYGLVSVWRKGSKGSGKKFQVAMMTMPELRPMLDWYQAEVRPWYVRRLKDANNQSFFLSERGERLSYTAFYERFKLALQRAGLAGMGFCPHCLRHTNATHELQWLSIQAISKKLGHEHLHTTLKYLHIPDEFLQEEINRSVESRMQAAAKAAA